MTRMTGVIFSDLGVASSFMAMDWVQSALREALGFTPFPATLNVRPKTQADAETWQRERTALHGIPLPSAQGGFCDANLYPVRVGAGTQNRETVPAAILVPAVKDYPSDKKIEIVAPMRLKDHFGVEDGDSLTLEFLN